MNQLFNNDRIPVLLIAMLLVVGFSSLVTMPRSEDPFITQRGASIITEFPGASAERVEALVSEKIEATLRQQPEINLISSSSSANISVVRIELQDSITEVAPVWSRIRDLLSDVESELPAGAGTPELDDDHGYAFTRIVGLKFHNDHQGLDQNNDDLAVLKRYALSLKDKLQNLPNTDFVELYGDPKEEVRVALNAYRSADLQMSAGQIAQLIAQSDAKVAAGQLHNPDNQYAVELTGALDSLQRIREIPLQTGDNATLVHLGDIADVQFVPLSPASNLVLLNGEKGIVVAARMLSGTRISDWTQDVNQLLARYQAQLPADIELVSLFDQSTYTQDRLTQLVENIALGFALICAVLFITLGWRAAIIVALALPLSVGFTLASMNFYGLPIHQMSVTGLVVALGIMVDNAIVMTDAIQQKRQAGATRAEAVNSAIRHLWIPLLGSTLTTILAFMPIVLMPGPSGEFVGGIALSVIFSLIGSYLVSHLIIAPLAGR
ncbi:MAG: efflux RND transporter permease subunit, partial [Pontibacterium sp.]